MNRNFTYNSQVFRNGAEVNDMRSRYENMLKKTSIILLALMLPELLMANSNTPFDRLSFYQEQARQGDAHAMFKLGYAYETGDGLPANQNSAVKWYTRASNKGHKNAQMNLDAMDASGKPFIDTESTYQKELTDKAECGDLDAQNALARMMINDVLKNSNRITIMEWVKTQAERGSSESQFLLAQMYYLGVAVPQNYVDAYVWYSLAAAAGDSIAMSSRNHVASLMSQGQIEKGQLKSRELFERLVARPIKHPDPESLDRFTVSSLP